jgi:tetratricopeptide (TPR) repeat protein
MSKSSRTGALTKDPTGHAPAGALRTRWERLHDGDREPYPDEKRVAKLAKQSASFESWVDAHGGPAAVAAGVQEAWRDFHAGEFIRAIEVGGKLGALGATAANKAAAIYSQYQGRSEARGLKLLEAARERGERAIELLPEYANAHYMLALALGRYSQRISIVRALAEGLATRVRTELDKTLELEPHHADAHIALGLFNAEIVSQLGPLIARVTYQVSQEAAIEHFRRAVKLAPKSPIAHIEYAQGLLLLDADSNREQARELYAQAAACKPADAMEQLDVERAKRGLD